jgi:hypothetical protein
MFGIEEMRDLYDERYTNDIFEFVDAINYLISWNMLKHKNLIFNKENSLDLIRNNQK